MEHFTNWIGLLSYQTAFSLGPTNQGDRQKSLTKFKSCIHSCPVQPNAMQEIRRKTLFLARESLNRFSVVLIFFITPAKCICQNSKMYLMKLDNVFAHIVGKIDFVSENRFIKGIFSDFFFTHFFRIRQQTKVTTFFMSYCIFLSFPGVFS